MRHFFVAAAKKYGSLIRSKGNSDVSFFVAAAKMYGNHLYKYSIGDKVASNFCSCSQSREEINRMSQVLSALWNNISEPRQHDWRTDTLFKR